MSAAERLPESDYLVGGVRLVSADEIFRALGVEIACEFVPQFGIGA